MKIKHKAPHLEKLKHLDVADRKAIKSYNNTRKRKIRAMKKNVKSVGLHYIISYL